MNLFSKEHFETKMWERMRDAKPEEFLPWEEARERYIEKKIEPLLEQYRESDHDWFKDFSRRRGEVMHSSDLIYRLQNLNPHIFVQQQIVVADDWGLYASVGGRVQYLSAVPKGWLTELSFCLIDSRDLPTEERRGWRTILIMCLYKGAISWEQVIREFGEPCDGFNDYRWCEATKDFRYGGDQIVWRNQQNVVE